MAICSLLKEVALLLYVIGISQAERDLLDTIRPNAENPPEVNDFLHTVLQYRNDFRWIRKLAQQSDITNVYKKSAFPSNSQMESLKRDTSDGDRRPTNDIRPYIYELDETNQNSDTLYSKRPVRNLRRKRKRHRLGIIRHRRSKGSIDLDLNNEQSTGEVKVVPRSESGIQNVPGQKYYGRHRKSSTPDTCNSADHNQHDVLWKNTSKANESKDASEYYFTTPHDLLGLSQDMAGSDSDSKNRTCIQSKKALVVARNSRNVTGGPSVLDPQQVKTLNAMAAAQSMQPPGPIKLTASPGLGPGPQQYSLAPSRPIVQAAYYPQSPQVAPIPGLQASMASASLSPLDPFPPIPTLRSTTTLSPFAERKFIPDTRNTDFIKLVHYIETPNRDQVPSSKQDLLRKENDDLLENIDHVLKADRSGLHMYRGMNEQQTTRKKDDDDSSSEKDPPFGMFKALENHPMLHNLLGSRRILPMKVAYSLAGSNKRVRSVGKHDFESSAEEDEDEHLPDVELKFNSRPIQKFKGKKPTNRRRINLNRKKKKKSDRHYAFTTTELTTSTTTMILPSSGLMFTISPTDNSVVNNPNIKLLENADDDNNKNLKMTLKEYLNRENAYNLEKQQQEEEEEDNSFDYNVAQQKKIELEDLTEPTSAAEQRELGRKDEPATPSMGNDDADNQFIVIPLKKQTSLENVGYRSADYETARTADSFKVKDSEDVIHLGKLEALLRDSKKNVDIVGMSTDKEPVQKRNLLQKENQVGVSENESPSILNLENDDYAYENRGGLNPMKQNGDYNYYENFEQKREISQANAPAFKRRKLQQDVNDDYYDTPYIEEMRQKRHQTPDYMIRDSYDPLDVMKRSEDDEPDEEPGNDAKEPHYKQKKVQENEPLDLSPKVEETETLHMDVIDPKRRSYADSVDYLTNEENETPDKRNNDRSVKEYERVPNKKYGRADIVNATNGTGAIAISITTIDDFQLNSDNDKSEQTTKRRGIEVHMKKYDDDITSDEWSSTKSMTTQRKKSTRKSTAPTCEVEEGDGEEKTTTQKTEECTEEETNDLTTCILISAKPVNLSSSELARYKEKQRAHETTESDESAEDSETESTKNPKATKKIKKPTSTECLEDTTQDKQEAEEDEECEEKKTTKTTTPSCDAVPTALSEEKENKDECKSESNEDKDKSNEDDKDESKEDECKDDSSYEKEDKEKEKNASEDAKLVCCYIDKGKPGKNVKGRERHKKREKNEYDKSKIVERGMKSKDDPDDDFDRKEKEYHKERTKADKDENEDSDEDDKDMENDDESATDHEVNSDKDEVDKDKDEVVIRKHGKKTESEEESDRDGDRGEAQENGDVSSEKEERPTKHRKPVKTSKEDEDDDSEPEIVYKHSRKHKYGGKKFNKVKYKNQKNDEDNEMNDYKKYKDYEDQASSAGNKGDEDKLGDIYKDGTDKRAYSLIQEALGITDHRPKTKERSPTVHSSNHHNDTKVKSTNCYVESVTTGSLGLVECLQGESEKTTECVHPTTTSGDGNGTQEPGDGEHADGEPPSNSEETEHPDKEKNDNEEHIHPEEEHPSDEHEAHPGEEHDAHPSEEQAVHTGEEHEVRPGEEHEGHNNEDHEGHPSEEHEGPHNEDHDVHPNEEHEVHPSEDHEDQEPEGERKSHPDKENEPRPGEEQDTSKDKTLGSHKTGEIITSIPESNKEYGETDKEAEDNQPGPTTPGDHNAINYNYFNVTINMISNEGTTDNAEAEGLDSEVEGKPHVMLSSEHDNELKELTKNIVELVKKGKLCKNTPQPSGHSVKPYNNTGSEINEGEEQLNDTVSKGGSKETSEEIQQAERKDDPAGREEDESKSKVEEGKEIESNKDTKEEKGNIEEGDKEAEDTKTTDSDKQETVEDTKEEEEIKQPNEGVSGSKPEEPKSDKEMLVESQERERKKEEKLKMGEASKGNIDTMKKKAHKQDHNGGNGNGKGNNKKKEGSAGLKENVECKEPVKQSAAHKENGESKEKANEEEKGNDDESATSGEEIHNENVEASKLGDNHASGDKATAEVNEETGEPNETSEIKKPLSVVGTAGASAEADASPKAAFKSDHTAITETNKGEDENHHVNTMGNATTDISDINNGDEGTLAAHQSSNTEEDDNTTPYENSHKEPLKSPSVPLKEAPVEEAELLVEPTRLGDGKCKPILIKSSTVVHIGSKTTPASSQSSTPLDVDDAIPQNIGQEDIKNIITSGLSAKLPISLVPRSHSVEELAEEEIQENDKRNAMGKKVKHLHHQEALVENLQKLIDRYKHRLKASSGPSRREAHSSVVHHHTEKKKQKSIPKDPCVTEPGRYYNDHGYDPVKRETKRSDTPDDGEYYHDKQITSKNSIDRSSNDNSIKTRQSQDLDDSDDDYDDEKQTVRNSIAKSANKYATRETTESDAGDDIEYYHEKHIMQNSFLPVARPAKEAYKDTESVDEELKERLLFQKVYDSVMRARKKAHYSDMYRSIDEYFDNTPAQDDDQPICPVDENMDNIEIPVKRKQEYEELQKEKQQQDEDATEDTGGGLVEVSRSRKKADEVTTKKANKKKLFKHNDSDGGETTAGNTDDTFEDTSFESTSAESSQPKVKLDDVESFKDVVEQPMAIISKRSTMGRQLKQLKLGSDSYLSPLLEDDNREENIRLRRKLRYLRHQPRQAPQPNRVMPFNYNAYIQNHRQGPRFGQNLVRSNSQNDNFHEAPNSNVSPDNYQSISTEGEISGTPNSNIAQNPTEMVTENTTAVRQTEVCEDAPNALRNRTTEDDELKKKEREDMRNMLNGDLPMNLINIFYGKLKDNNALYSRFGGSITSSKECAFENVMNIKAFREDQAKVDIKHAEEMLHEVIVMLNRIVADQVHRKTCLKLSPNLKLFIVRITKGMRNFKKSGQIAEGYPLPKIKYRSNEEYVTPPTEEEQGQLLFEEGDRGKETNAEDKIEIRKRIKLIEKLLEKYQKMSMRCQVQVEPVRNYLMEHLQMLMKMLEKSESSATSTMSAMGGNQQREPQISEEELVPPRQAVLPNQMDDKAEFTTIEQRSIQVNKDQDSEIAHRQQILMETQQDQRKIDAVNHFISEQQKENDFLIPSQARDDKQHSQRDLEYRSPDFNGNEVHNALAGNAALHQSEQCSPASSIAAQPPPIPPPPPQQVQTAPSQIQPQVTSQPQAINGQFSQTAQASPSEQQSFSPRIAAATPPLIGPPLAPPLNKEMLNATVSAMTGDVPKSKYSYPELVTKDLMQLGLGGTNTYIPPFSVAGVVKEQLSKMNNEAINQPITPPSPPKSENPQPSAAAPSNDVSPVLMQTSYISGSSTQSALQYQPHVRSDSQDQEDQTQTLQPEMVMYSDATTAGKDPSLVEKQRFKRVTSDDSEEDSNEEASSKIRQLALNPYQEPLHNVFPDRSSKLHRSTIQSEKIDEINDANLVTELPSSHMEINTENSPADYTYTQEDLPQNTQKIVPEMLEGGPDTIVMPLQNPEMIRKQVHENMPNFDESSFLISNVNYPKKEKQPSSGRQKTLSKKTNWDGTEKYKKLMAAYESMREKRQNDERLAKLFGNKIDDKMAIKTANKQIQDISKVNFEKPLVFSLD